MGKIFLQKGGNGKLYLIIFFLIKYVAQKVNYNIYNKKLLAVVKIFKKIKTKARKNNKPVYYIYKLRKPGNVFENKGFFIIIYKII